MRFHEATASTVQISHEVLGHLRDASIRASDISQRQASERREMGSNERNQYLTCCGENMSTGAEEHSPIWQYWEGPKPAWIELSMRSVAHFAGCRLRVLDAASWNDIRGRDLDIDLSTLYITHRVDFLRSYLLAEFGGTWIDADFVQLRPLKEVDTALCCHEVVAYLEDGQAPMSNFFAAREGSRIARTYYDLIAAKLRLNRRVSAWGELAETLFAEALAVEASAVTYLDHRLIQPISWQQIARTIYQRVELPAGGMGVMLYGQALKRSGAGLERMTTDELYRLPGTLGDLFRQIRDLTTLSNRKE